MKSIDEGTINQYKWLKIAQAIILIVLGFIFILAGWLSKEGINDALSYCLGVVFAAYGTINIVAGYLLHRTPINSPVFVGLVSLGFGVIFFVRANLLEMILTPFLVTLLFGICVMLIVHGVDRVLAGRKMKKRILAEEIKEDGKDFELIKRLRTDSLQEFKKAAISFVVAAVIVALGAVYLFFYLTQEHQVERYLVICVGLMTLVFGIAALASTLRQIKNTKEMIMEEKMKKQAPTYNDSNEILNTDVRIIDISELKKTRRRRSLPKSKAAAIEDEKGKKDGQSAQPEMQDNTEADPEKPGKTKKESFPNMKLHSRQDDLDGD